MSIILLRHGRTKEAVKGYAQPPEAELHKEYLYLLDTSAKKLRQYTADKIFVSPYQRTLATAEYVFPTNKYVVLNYIHEFKTPSTLYEKSKEERIAFWEQDHVLSKRDPNWKFDNTSESFNNILKRVIKLYKLLISQNKTIVVVGHGTFFLHFLGYSLYEEKYTPDHFFDLLIRKFDVDNGGYYNFKNINKKLVINEIFRNM